MDVDNDLDSSFIQKFSTLGTTDKDVLIQEFQRLLGNQLNRDGCAFFLDMSNWNLQDAICAYFDFGGGREKQMNMSVIQESNNVLTLPANTTFTKTWQMKNSGEEAWPEGCFIHFTGGLRMSQVDKVQVRSVRAGVTTHVSLEMISPENTGSYESKWRMCTLNGTYFGDELVAVVNVELLEVHGVTQQLELLNFVNNSGQQYQNQATNHSVFQQNGVEHKPNPHHIAETDFSPSPDCTSSTAMPIPIAHQLPTPTHLTPNLSGSPIQYAPHNSPIMNGTYLTSSSSSGGNNPNSILTSAPFQSGAGDNQVTSDNQETPQDDGMHLC